MNAIIAYKRDGTLPYDLREASKLEKKASWFKMFQGQLNKRSFSRPFLKCVPPEKGQEVLDNLH